MVYIPISWLGKRVSIPVIISYPVAFSHSVIMEAALDG